MAFEGFQATKSEVAVSDDQSIGREHHEVGKLSLVQQAAEQDETKAKNSINRALQAELESNMIGNISESLSRANMPLGTQPRGQNLDLVQGIAGVDKLAGFPDPKDFWHSDNDRTEVVKYVAQNVGAYEKDPDTVKAALLALQTEINVNQLSSHTEGCLDDPNRDRVRQMAENAAMIEMAIAGTKPANDPDARALVAGSGMSAKNLIRIASENGANPDNVVQLKELMEEYRPTRYQASEYRPTEYS